MNVPLKATASLITKTQRPSLKLAGVLCASQTRGYPSMAPRPRPLKPKQVFPKPREAEGSSATERSEAALDNQSGQLRMSEMEALRGRGRLLDPLSAIVPNLAHHIPRRIRPFILSGKLNVARKVWLREQVERLKDAVHFWQAAQHPVVPGMTRRPKWWHFGDLLSVRSLSDKRPLAMLRRQALEQYIQLHELEAKGLFKPLSNVMTEPLLTTIQNRIKQRGSRAVTYEWKFHGETEPTRCLSFRMIPGTGLSANLPESEAAVQQALMKYKTKQSLVVRSADGTVLSGDHASPKVVTDYFVMEHKNWERSLVDTSAGPQWRLKAQFYEIPTEEMMEGLRDGKTRNAEDAHGKAEVAVASA